MKTLINAWETRAILLEDSKPKFDVQGRKHQQILLEDGEITYAPLSSFIETQDFPPQKPPISPPFWLVYEKRGAFYKIVTNFYIRFSPHCLTDNQALVSLEDGEEIYAYTFSNTQEIVVVKVEV